MFWMFPGTFWNLSGTFLSFATLLSLKKYCMKWLLDEIWDLNLDWTALYTLKFRLYHHTPLSVIKLVLCLDVILNMQNEKDRNTSLLFDKMDFTLHYVWGESGRAMWMSAAGILCYRCPWPVNYEVLAWIKKNNEIAFDKEQGRGPCESTEAVC